MTNKQLKILLIEDNPFDAHLIKRVLVNSPAEKVDLVWVDCLSKGLEHLQTQKADVLLLDLGLPDSWGLETVKRVREWAPEIPVLVLTGYEDKLLAEQAVQAGAQDYVPKGNINGPLLLNALYYAIQRQKLLVELEQKRRELEQRATQLALINEIGQKIATVLKLDCLLDNTACLVHKAFGYHHVALFLVDKDVAQLKAIAGSYTPYFPSNHSQKLSQGIIGWVATHGGKVVANDVGAEPRYISLIADRTETRAELCLPIKVAGQTVGVLDLQSPHLNTFGENDIIAMETLTNQLAVALENAHLYEALQQELNERRQTEEALRQSEQRFRQVISSISDHIYTTEIAEAGGHKNIYLSPNIEHLTGYPVEKFMADWNFWLETVIHPNDRAVAMAQLAYLAKGQNSETEYRLLRADGDIIWVRDSGRSEQDPIRNSIIIYGVVSDITKRKFLESQLVQAQKLEAIGQLAAGIAHEINTPTQYIGDNITFVQGSFTKIRYAVEKYDGLLQQARAGNVTSAMVAEVDNAIEKGRVRYQLEEIPLAIEEALEGVGRVAGIVRAMKEFSHPGVEEKAAININHAIESTTTIARNEWKYIAEMETYFDPDLPPVPCLPGEFNQAILNVLINAAHAIADAVDSGHGEKGRITITTRRDGDWAEIRLSDTGTGIPESLREKIFNPFFTTKQVGRGTGQGLAIAHAVIVEKHGGAITFETEVGQGTTFIIRLPLELGEEIGGFDVE